jgi:acyl-CoA reductase-like NAD-dependent aldehyde dehydrogenase
MRQGIARLEMFVDGDWRPSEEGRTDQVLNPSAGEVVAEVQSGNAQPRAKKSA